MNTVNCIKLNKKLPALERKPYPGELGDKILQNVSQNAWGMWLEHQTMLINENHLSMIDPKAQAFLKEQLEKFFFSVEGADKIQGYTPKK
ncbi:FIG001341: Probable Fe(2+)-trafficking protein YggX [hydrothermal vent metagenome]|uniref:FIG001341: Probable Fe(2+)-trafficking protein YggX n=1 Tax=hydrothermal vent metagenome TaxID=652676 RepID=A0A1W1CQP0_9ZZZZ